MQIVRLRLLGFKSFVEPAELIVERGLTGVVGPNGCGKSNLLEALRWVMGEASHKSMRAAAMDDVIFAGTSMRPPREVAEVTMVIDNTARDAPAELNHSDTIEITRRIEREQGSIYRINGREARARDVKILFEDAATGARSPALVRQGQIGEIVNAKPEQRRRILEDAAGIAGLHSRRHEADLRLRAAEGNMQRINDVLGQLTSQAEALKRQARAARRYKDVSADIRKSEALVLHLSWAEAQALVLAEEAALAAALALAAETTDAEAAAQREEAAAGEALPPLREAEARAAAALARLETEQGRLDREAARAAERERELVARLAENEADVAREEALLKAASGDLARHDLEHRDLESLQTAAEANVAAATVRVGERETAAQAAEAHLSALSGAAAEAKARRATLESARAERAESIARIERRVADLDRQSEAIAAHAPDSARSANFKTAVEALEGEASAADMAAAVAEAALRDCMSAAAAKREALAKMRLRGETLAAERDTITRLLAVPGSSEHAPIVDALAVAEGYETALGAALGDDLEAPTAAEAPAFWSASASAGASEDVALPHGAEPLSVRVQGPPEIMRRLRQIGVVAAETGAPMQPLLRQGQRLVTLAGDLWRWDGFVARAGRSTPAAQRLELRHRLNVLEGESAALVAEMEALTASEREASAALVKANAEDKLSKQQQRAAETALVAAREEITAFERARRDHETRLASLDEQRDMIRADLAALRDKYGQAEAALATEAKIEDGTPALHAAETNAIAARRGLAEAAAMLASLARESTLRGERLVILAAERQRSAEREANAREQVRVLGARGEDMHRDLAAIRALPEKLAEECHRLAEALAGAGKNARASAEALTTQEDTHRATLQALRVAQTALGEAREEKARVEVRLDGARTRRQDEARRIRETLSVAPDACLALAELGEGAPLPALADASRQLDKLKADRERLGGVNLTADDELAKIASQVSTLDQERADVDAAIAKLRGAIGQLNREGKARLDEAFAAVDGHFQRLFTTLFNGGEARLDMIAAEDPLEGGLEIIARPPGKKPATLSLLSGGEQSLTALALIFAVFLTNPSPICVLDEVDAPLDDANVDRFCTLMEKMAAETATRFLVITHHPMTMTRMNRLFGVTMQEKGVSQLVSVDLEQAVQFREAG